jgi:hypothetical protein
LATTAAPIRDDQARIAGVAACQNSTAISRTRNAAAVAQDNGGSTSKPPNIGFRRLETFY